MLTIRLMRFGRRNRPFFRLVIVPKRSKPKSGKYIELLGWHDPLKHQSKLESERVKYWMSQGAKPSPTAWNLMVTSGVVEGAKIAKHKKIQSKEPAPVVEASAVKETVTPESMPPAESLPETKAEENLEAQVPEEAPEEVKETTPQESEETEETEEEAATEEALTSE